MTLVGLNNSLKLTAPYIDIDSMFISPAQCMYVRTEYSAVLYA